jgi:hypothetical protein
MELPQKIHPLRRDPHWLLKYLKLIVLNILLIGLFGYLLFTYREFPATDHRDFTVLEDAIRGCIGERLDDEDARRTIEIVRLSNRWIDFEEPDADVVEFNASTESSSRVSSLLAEETDLSKNVSEVLLESLF